MVVGEIKLINHSLLLIVHLDYIMCVRWSPSGDLLAAAAADSTVGVLDFKTGKTLYTGLTSDGRKFSLFDSLINTIFPLS